MEDQLGNNGQIAANNLATQHILVSKGVCTYEELVEANKRAMEVVVRMSEALSPTGVPDTGIVMKSVSEMIEFIGGASAVSGMTSTLNELSKSLQELVTDKEGE
jgi:hypothetical protein